MNRPSYDPNENQRDELSASEATELEKTLRSFRPRQPIGVSTEPRLELSAMTITSPQPRNTNAWTLGTTWISGAIVGGLFVFVLGQTGPATTSPPASVKKQTATVDRQPSQPLEAPGFELAYESEAIDRLLSEPWSESNYLSASSHLAFQVTPKSQTDSVLPLATRELPSSDTPRPTHQQMLRELLSDPNGIL